MSLLEKTHHKINTKGSLYLFNRCMTYPPFYEYTIAYDDQSHIELKTFNITYIPKNNCGGSCDLL